MNARIRRIIELCGNNRVRLRLVQLIALPNRPRHPLRPRRQHEIRPENSQQPPPLHRHRFRHRQCQLISLRRAYKRQCNTRISRGRFKDVRVLIDLAGLFARFDHRRADAILDRAERIKIFAFGQHRRAARRHDAVDSHEGRIANGLNNA